jgi:hypothetical protein
MALGSGIVVTNVALPVYLPDHDAYGTGRGAASFSRTSAISILIISDRLTIKRSCRSSNLENLYEFSAKYGRQETISLASNVAKGNTTRLFFLPRFGDAFICFIFWGADRF